MMTRFFSGRKTNWFWYLYWGRGTQRDIYNTSFWRIGFLWVNGLIKGLLMKLVTISRISRKGYKRNMRGLFWQAHCNLELDKVSIQPMTSWKTIRTSEIGTSRYFACNQTAITTDMIFITSRTSSARVKLFPLWWFLVILWYYFRKKYNVRIITTFLGISLMLINVNEAGNTI